MCAVFARVNRRPRLSLLCLAALAAATIALVVHAQGVPYCYVVDNGTVIDNRTGLVWQQTVASSTMTWSDAQAYCAGLTLNGATWRLPTLQELVTIQDDTNTLDQTAFPGQTALSTWSATPSVGSTSTAWVGMSRAGYTIETSVGVAQLVRCVH